MESRIRTTIEDHVAHVVLDRPEKKNALDSGMFQGLRDTARELAEDRDVRAVVLSGAGDCFSSGLDFASFSAMASGDLSAESEDVKAAAADLSRDGAHAGQQLGWLWYELPVPVIAAIRGVAYGGGFHIALGADIRLVAPDARIAFVEIEWGLVPDLSGTQALRRLVPLDVAKRLVFTGEPISGERAVAWNLCTELSDDPVGDALALARRIAQKNPDAVRIAKQLLNDSGLVSVSEGLANELRASEALMGTPNQIEAVQAKLGRREPRFRDPA